MCDVATEQGRSSSGADVLWEFLIRAAAKESVNFRRDIQVRKHGGE